MTEPAVRAYLLGTLPESEVEQVETRLIEDEDLFSEMETAEDDLFDAYVRGTLAEDDRRRFLERFGGDLTRRRFAKVFVQRVRAGNVVPFYRRRWVELAMAASLVIVVGAVMTRRDPGGDVVPTAPATPPSVTVPAVAVPVIARVPLALGTSRAAGTPVTVTVDRGASAIDFVIRLNPADRFPAYRVEIKSQADNIVWGNATLAPASENGELVVHAVVPADRVPSGSYEIAVRGASAAAIEDLGFLTLEVNRPK